VCCSVASSQGDSAIDLSQCVAVRCSVLQSCAVCFRILHSVDAMPGYKSQCNRPVAVYCSVLQCIAVNVQQYIAAC